MKKKLLLAGLLALSPLAANAGWEVGGSYLNISYETDGEDLTLGGIAATVGYTFPMQENFTLVPEFRVGFGMSDDSVSGPGGELDFELDQMYGMNLRARFELDNGFSLFVLPSYTNYEVSASGTVGGISFSESDDTWEFGIGAGAGYQFNDAFGLEAAYEVVDEVDMFSIGVRVKL